MAFELKMPQLGLTMEEGTVSRWLKQEGDAITAGEAVLEITTDKLTNDVECDTDGTLLKILVECDEDYPCGTPIAILGQPGEDISGLV